MSTTVWQPGAIPRVVDISHHNVGTLPHGKIDFAALNKTGIWGVIHKASQGASYADPTYVERRILANAAGLLWGAYHFNTGERVVTQVNKFVAAAKPDDYTLMVLDFEDNRASQMSVFDAVRFLRELEQKIGRKGAIYSGNRIKETIQQLPAPERTYLALHRLWLCQYGPRAVLPAGWTNYWLWQYTGDGIGPTPHSIPGIAGNGIDLNTYAGTREQLAAEWAGHPTQLATGAA